MKKQSKMKRVICVLAVIFVVLGAGTVWYINDYYHADNDALEAVKSDQEVTVTKEGKKMLVFEPENIKAGFIFYPGGKVQYEAYAPLMQKLSKKGFLCVLVKMPVNLAVFDVNAADGIQSKFPQVTKWYLGGHSLGGAMAASYASKHSAEYEGMVLMAAYSTADLTDSGLKVISVYGSEDGVLAMEKYKKYKVNFPKDFQEYKIEGGCHAYFGSYGEQDGDGKALITREEQQEETAAIMERNFLV